jgi:hypothetical protein
MVMVRQILSDKDSVDLKQVITKREKKHLESHDCAIHKKYAVVTLHYGLTHFIISFIV